MADDQAWWRRMGQATARRARSSGGFATVGVALALVSMTSLVLVGAGATKAGLRFGSGFAWLGSDEQHQAMLVNGTNGQGTNRLTFPGEGELEVRMFGEHAYVVLKSRNGDRVLYRLDDQDQSRGVHRAVAEGQTLIRSGDRAWLVDRKDGTVIAVDPETLENVPDRENLAFTPPIVEAPDSQGRLVVVEQSTAKAYVVEDGRGGALPVGEPGDALDVSTVEDHPAVINASRDEVQVFEDGRPSAVALPPGNGVLTVAPAGEGKELVLLRRDGTRGELLFVDVENRSVRPPVVIEGGVPMNAGEPWAVADAVFLVDSTGGNVLVVDPTTGKVRRVPLDLPRDREPDAFVKDGRLWVNDAGGDKALIVEPDGTRHPVNKYDRKVPEVSAPGDAPAPDETSRPEPGPAPSPRPGPGGGDQGGGLPGGPGPGPGAGAPPPVATPPGMPRQFTASGSDGSIELTWQAPSDGGAPILGYQLTCRPDCGRAGRGTFVPPGETYAVDGLKNGDTYQFELTARNAVGESPAARASGRPTADVPPAPTNVTATPNNTGTVTLRWKSDAGGLTLTGFQITASTPAGLTASFTQRTVAAGADQSFTTPPDELRYDDDATPEWSFEVRALAGSTVGQPATSQSPVDPFKAPDLGGALTPSAASGQVNLTWPAAKANGRPVTYEVARCQGTGCGNYSVVNVKPTGAASGQMSALVTGLTNGTTYGFRVRAQNDAGFATKALTTSAMPVGQPQLRITGSSSTSDSVTATFAVDWLGPAGTCTANGAAMSCGGTFTAGPLQASHTYSYTLCAVRDGKQGCSPVSITTKAPPTYSVTIENNSGSAEVYNNTGAGRQVGPSIAPGTTIQVRCRKYDSTISYNPGYYWYLVATSPWTNGWLPASVTDPDDNPGYNPAIPVC